MKIFAEVVVHESLESVRSIGQAERHNQKFIMAFMSAECCFWNIIWFYSDLVVPRTKVQLRKDSSFVKFIQEFIDHGNRKFIGHGNLGQSPVIHTKSPTAVLFFNEKNRARQGTNARLNNVGDQHLANKPLYLSFLKIRVPVGLYTDWRHPCLKSNSVIVSSWQQ